MPYSNIYDISVLTNFVCSFLNGRKLVKTFSDGSQLIIEKPGYKKNKNDFKIIYKLKTEEEKPYKHKEIFDMVKNSPNKDNLIKDIDLVCDGKQPSNNYNDFEEVILEFLKWVFVEEDINYPGGEGRNYTLDALHNYINNPQI